MKPKLLLNVGINHCATTPFYYTLAVTQQYCHSGHKKEINYLHMIQENGGFQKYVDKITTLKTYNRDDDKKPPMLKKWKWDPSEMPEYFELPFTIEKYIAAKKKDWEYIKNDYQSLADWSNSNAALSREFLTKLKPQLEEHFDVKCVIILRDPIRRLFALSKYNDKFERNVKGFDFSYKLNDNGRFEKHVKGFDFSYSLAEVIPTEYHLHVYADYAGICKKWKDIWGDKFMPVIMEEFWEDPSQLSDFLEYPITKVHRNVYWPEMGANYPKYEYLMDQWNPREDITEENLKLAKRKMSHIYQAFEEYFGYMPSAWQSS